MNKSIFFLLPFLSLHLLSSFSYSMDVSAPQTLRPCYIIDLFTIKKQLKNDGSYINTINKSNIALNPYGTQLIIGTKGSVFSLNTQSSQLKRLFKHPDTHCAPLLALAQQRKDAPLLIASVGNYFNSGTKKWHSHLIIYKNDEHFAESEHIKTHEFHWPIQSIKFNKSGKILALGSTSFVSIYNTATGTSHGASFETETTNTNIVTDLAINSEGTQVIAARQEGTLECFVVENKKTLRHVNTTHPLFTYQKIHIPHANIFMAASDCHSTAVIRTNTLMTTKNTITKSYPFSDESSYENSSLNSDWQIACAHWTKNKNASKKNRYSLIVTTAQNNCCSLHNDLQNISAEQLILQIPQYKETYRTLTNTGQLIEEKEYCIAVSFSNNHLVALNSCGKLFLWELPFNNCKNDNLKEKVTIEEKHPKKIKSSYIIREQSYESLLTQGNNSTISPTSENCLESETVSLSTKKKNRLNNFKKFGTEKRISFRKKNSSSPTQTSPRDEAVPKESPQLKLYQSSHKSFHESDEKK